MYIQISLREGCRKILVADSFNLLERLVKTQRKAILIEGMVHFVHFCIILQSF